MKISTTVKAFILMPLLCLIVTVSFAQSAIDTTGLNNGVPFETVQYGEWIDSVVTFWNDAWSRYRGGDNRGFVAFMVALFGALSGVKLTQLTMSIDFLRKLISSNDIRILVGRWLLIIAGLITLISTGFSDFDLERFIAIAFPAYLLADPIYNLLRRLGWIKKTEQFNVETKKV